MTRWMRGREREGVTERGEKGEGGSVRLSSRARPESRRFLFRQIDSPRACTERLESEPSTSTLGHAGAERASLVDKACELGVIYISAGSRGR